MSALDLARDAVLRLTHAHNRNIQPPWMRDHARVVVPCLLAWMEEDPREPLAVLEEPLAKLHP